MTNTCRSILNKAGLLAALLLVACHATGQDKVVVEPLPPKTSDSVVLLDPTVDDAMLPALGERMSEGRVVIYDLNAPPAPDPLLVARGRGEAGGPLTPMPVTDSPYAPSITLRPPLSDDGRVVDATRVTIYSPETGAPVQLDAAPVKMERIAPDVTSAPQKAEAKSKPDKAKSKPAKKSGKSGKKKAAR